MPRYSRKSGVHLRQMDDQMFLADPDTNVLYHLNATGGAIWRLLEEPVSIAEAAEILCEAFPDIDAAAIRADLDALFAELAANGLIVALDGEPN